MGRLAGLSGVEVLRQVTYSIKKKEPKKRKGYYEVYFTGANATAIQGQEQTLYLIPAV